MGGLRIELVIGVVRSQLRLHILQIGERCGVIASGMIEPELQHSEDYKNGDYAYDNHNLYDFESLFTRAYRINLHQQ